MNKKFFIRIQLVCIFAIAFAFVEASVVVYLRAIYYPQGFQFPIKRLYDIYLVIEIIREFATIIMMISISAVLCRKFWEGFAYFLVIFGVWDVFYYLFLKLTINWPASILEPDILFLIPVPWIGPVLAPVLVSLAMVIIGIDILRLFDRGQEVKPAAIHWILVLAGSAIILYSFTSDINAAFYEKYPLPYKWYLLAAGLVFYAAAHLSLRKRASQKNKIK